MAYAQSIAGVVYDKETNEPLAFANIGVVGKPNGSVSNINGQFYISLDGFVDSDTIVCTYIGYNPQRFHVGSLGKVLKIPMESSSVGIKGIVVLSKPIMVKEILQKMNDRKDSNYASLNVMDEVFSRSVNESRKKKLKIKFKNSTIDYFNDAMFQNLSQLLPPKSMYYEDWFYRNYHFGDKVKKQKVKGIAHAEGDFDELEVIGTEIEKILNKKTGKDTYWKVKSGVFSFKMDQDNQSGDSTKKPPHPRPGMNDSISNVVDTLALASSYDRLDSYIEKKVWSQEFIQGKRNYQYSLEGTTFISGEAAYVIRFYPKNNGMEGSMYVSMDTYALLQLNYKKAADTKNEGLKMLGIEYRILNEESIVYFHRYKNNYRLKYIMAKQVSKIGVKRPLGFVQKRKRFLFDKKTEEVEFKVDAVYVIKNIKEFLVTNTKDISQKEYQNVRIKKGLFPVFVKQYNDPNIWKGYSVIEPTKEMKAYRTQKKN